MCIQSPRPRSSGGDRAGEAAVVIYVNCSWPDGGGSRQKQEWRTDSGAQQRRGSHLIERLSSPVTSEAKDLVGTQLQKQN